MRKIKDLRQKNFITIDSSDTKDIDDAVCVEQTGGGFKLFVAIADVSRFVMWESALDLEARLKSTSVYTLGKVQHMLPDSLSQGDCSLFEQVERHTFVCEITYDHECNRVGDAIFYEGLIINKKQVSYDWANALISGAAKPKNEFEIMIHQQLMVMDYMREKLVNLRMLSGAAIIERTEAKYKLITAEDIVELRQFYKKIYNLERSSYNQGTKLGVLFNLPKEHFAKNLTVGVLFDTFKAHKKLGIKQASNEELALLHDVKDALNDLAYRERFTDYDTIKKHDRAIKDALNISFEDKQTLAFCQEVKVNQLLKQDLGVVINDIKLIYPNVRQNSEKIVEEFMIAANNCAGIEVSKTTNLFLRRHEQITPEGIAELKQKAINLGLKIEDADILNSFTRFAPEHKSILDDLRLSVMHTAEYVQANEAHAGLGLAQYAQFTSPIRRYSDLIVHHIIKGNDVIITPAMVEHINECKKAAQTEERRVERIKTTKYYTLNFKNTNLSAKVVAELKYDDGNIKGYIVGFNDGSSTFLKHFRGNDELSMGQAITLRFNQVTNHGPKYQIVAA